ncbi:TonB-dependent receptor plug domain-containing protein [Massilia sp. NEAU-DD11]|uniref:TonB-dependent receptor plug domain-containing protein n=2 Tax=Massilia cellulosiltytica TaxID=2683234 RepID=A0A7X3G5X7_9BURK|nr:TonB-dependent receptor plug domain-containing protein [Telluria cellulosilytica]
MAALMLALPAHAEEAARRAEFADLSIEELANIDVTSVSRRPERLQDAPASVYVITADDIRRSGARNLVEALNLAPNLQVARGSNANYFISARGMNGTSNSPANKLLVMIDGRSVYSPLFSGMFWDEPDVMLEDVERIEVISGPGGTLWGVNAVNGVINITTRHARDTQGDLLVLRADVDGAQAAFRHGGAMDSGHWRAYGKAFGLGHSELASGRAIDDDWTQGQVGWRGDWERGAERFSVNANAWRGREGQPAPGVIAAPGAGTGLDDIRLHGANVTGRWEHVLDGGGSVTAQAYYDYRYRKVPPTFTDAVGILDLQLQHALPAHGRHSMVWGGEYRTSRDRVDNSRFVAFLPARDTQTWASLFAQDEVALRDDLRATAGVRWERNPYTGTEFLPNVRLSWRATPMHAFWAAVSRTVRAPSRLDVDAYVPGAPPYLLAGGRGVRTETARVLELGYRGQAGQIVSYSVTAFRNLYDHLRTQDVTPAGQIVFGNLMAGQARGLEAWGNVQMTQAWRLSAGATLLHEQFALKPGSRDQGSLMTTGRDPACTAQLRSSHAIDAARELELAVRRNGALGLPNVPAYWAVDARFGWRFAPGMELSVIGTNLNGGHAEYGVASVRTEVPRTVGVKFTWER